MTKTPLPPNPNDQDLPPQGQLPLSTRQENQFHRTCEALLSRREQAQDLGFLLRDFLLCCLPCRRTKKTEYERRNGAFTLLVSAPARYGIPFGQDRLFLIWLCSAFYASGLPEDNVIRFRSAHDLLRTFDLPVDGHSLAMLKERILRVCAAQYLFEETRLQTARTHLHFYKLVEELDLWFTGDDLRNHKLLWQNVIRLTPRFANDLRRHVVPIDLNTVRALKLEPAVLDLYLFQAHRSYRLDKEGQHREVRVPVLGEQSLLWQLGTETRDPWRVQQLLRRWQQRVHEVWRECPNQLTDDSRYLLIRPAKAIQPQASLKLPGVQRHPPLPKFSEEELRALFSKPERKSDTSPKTDSPRFHLKVTQDQEPDRLD